MELIINNLKFNIQKLLHQFIDHEQSYIFVDLLPISFRDLFENQVQTMIFVWTFL